ncbi:arginase family protein [Reyranella sp. CPCC 100927]|uniref:arginase family protein n=1 Tax=Reyranella sp. CPCC 100927 TaxID=2599616 RepID=UPI0011B4F5D7|nr:arginase family protein [Reyranella sp. CPCC 100927]TWT11418.1 agmatinase [Reyranella sp. CPCC 100927]
MSPFSFTPSFMGVPHRTEIGDAKAAILGIPFDCGTHPQRVGSRLGPAAIREQSHLLRAYDWTTGINPIEALGVIDVGDAQVVSSDVDAAYPVIERAVEAIASRRAVPVTLGGDGAIALPEMRALHRIYPELVTVHIDAHTDAYPVPGYNTATPFARAVEEGLVDPRRSFQVGMRGSTMVPGVHDHGLKLGYTVIPMDQLLATGIAATFADISARIGDRPVYLCYDMDFFDPSVAPGVCTPTWGGASAREGLAALAACGGLNLVGVSINTVSPPHDVGGMSALLAATVALNSLHMIARQRQATAR